ncbi:MAG: transporter substrate-binding domain-containing protein [Bacteroidetes bacterium]|nr:transporter substrate-binding domain-containing protein [Bacteroidota bacterium]MBU1114085.1 transporter substrate-binding domain-containing protein [Bacteroidota bacterium]MBU1798867.1 transporter substrate-binding domain-containing protein [Bacteroidota bacterium]
MGYEYELLTRLAKYLNLELEIKVARTADEMIRMLNNGEGDLIANNLIVTKRRKNLISFANHSATTYQVLVQRKPQQWREMKLHEIDAALIRNPVDLIGKKIHVAKNSTSINRLKNLSEELGEDFKIIVAADTVSSEEIIIQVAKGEIDYTVENESVARLLQYQYPNIDVDLAISLPQRVAWGVRKDSPILLNAINEWLDIMKKKNDYYAIYQKYFDNKNSFRRRFSSDFFSMTGGSISVYDNLLKSYANSLHWDWRLLASLVYQESKFHSDKTSVAGAKGLMQLMPATAQQFGIDSLSSAHDNLEAGVKYLKLLCKSWKAEIPDSSERMKFVMASYNIGQGHVEDARRLAEKYGAEKNVWFDNVEFYLLQKANSKYYKDKVVRNGSAKGKETVKYVREIFDRYEHYQQFIQ